MIKTTLLVSLLVFSTLAISACRRDRAVMGLTNAQVAPVQATVAK